MVLRSAPGWRWRYSAALDVTASQQQSGVIDVVVNVCNGIRKREGFVDSTHQCTVTD